MAKPVRARGINRAAGLGISYGDDGLKKLRKATRKEAKKADAKRRAETAKLAAAARKRRTASAGRGDKVVSAYQVNQTEEQWAVIRVYRDGTNREVERHSSERRARASARSLASSARVGVLG